MPLLMTRSMEMADRREGQGHEERLAETESQLRQMNNLMFGRSGSHS